MKKVTIHITDEQMQMTKDALLTRAKAKSFGSMMCDILDHKDDFEVIPSMIDDQKGLNNLVYFALLYALEVEIKRSTNKEH